MSPLNFTLRRTGTAVDECRTAFQPGEARTEAHRIRPLTDEA